MLLIETLHQYIGLVVKDLLRGNIIFEHRSICTKIGTSLHVAGRYIYPINVEIEYVRISS